MQATLDFQFKSESVFISSIQWRSLNPDDEDEGCTLENKGRLRNENTGREKLIQYIPFSKYATIMKMLQYSEY